jgi:hypothetical protein
MGYGVYTHGLEVMCEPAGASCNECRLPACLTAVASDGTVELQPGLRTSFTHLLARKHAGQDVNLSVVRHGRATDVTVRWAFLEYFNCPVQPIYV